MVQKKKSLSWYRTIRFFFLWKIPEGASVGVQLPVDFRYRKDSEKLTLSAGMFLDDIFPQPAGKDSQNWFAVTFSPSAPRSPSPSHSRSTISPVMLTNFCCCCCCASVLVCPCLFVCNANAPAAARY
uniref:(northern house mosquito) hypothetical protein n=1 Tax=Culex pipiens TaxID=7175 RepID=A0A8D8B3T2_CULPI